MANAVEMSTMRKLVAQLNRYRHEYYNLNAPSVADDVYDYMYDELLALEEHTGVCMANSPTQTVGYPVVSALPKVAHDIPLLSLDKAKSIEALIAFQAGRTVDLSLKLDGLTTELIYENGQLIRLSTRGDGYIGENITHNAKAISGIPERIPYPADTGNALEVSKLFRHLVQKAISRCLTEPNLWYLKTKRPDLNAHLSTYRGSLHYPDYNYHGNLSVLQGHRKDTELTIGAAAKCVCCGNELRSNGAIKCSCKEVAVCRKCGQTVARGQGIYLEDGFYCKTCLHICAACGRPTLGTMYPAYNRRGTLVEVCQDCYQQLTSGCASCSMASACRAMGHTLCEKATVAVA